jgi:hypothetical protein
MLRQLPLRIPVLQQGRQARKSVVGCFRPPRKPYSQRQIELAMLGMIRKQWRAGVVRERDRDAVERQQTL